MKIKQVLNKYPWGYTAIYYCTTCQQEQEHTQLYRQPNWQIYCRQCKPLNNNFIQDKSHNKAKQTKLKNLLTKYN